MRFAFMVGAGAEEELREAAARHGVTVGDRTVLNPNWDSYVCEADSKVRACSFAQDFMDQTAVMEYITWM